jgi:AAA15 family ATPase/GTPase
MHINRNVETQNSNIQQTTLSREYMLMHLNRSVGTQNSNIQQTTLPREYMLMHINRALKHKTQTSRKLHSFARRKVCRTGALKYETQTSSKLHSLGQEESLQILLRV